MTRWNSKKTPVAVGTYLKIPVMGDFAHQTIGSDDWFEWLEAEGNTTFYVEGHPHRYTARREKRRRKYYWYAYKKENDQLYEDNDVKIIVDKKSFFYLVGTTLEYSGGLNGKGFVFNNPNANRTCGCGESFSL